MDYFENGDSLYDKTLFCKHWEEFRKTVKIITVKRVFKYITHKIYISSIGNINQFGNVKHPFYLGYN